MIVIVGPGAMGGLLAARFIQAGLPVSLVARSPSAADRLRRDGLRIEGALELRLKGSDFAAVAPGDKLPRTDLVIMCVKSDDTPAAAAAAGLVFESGTTVLSLQNGLAHVAVLRREFGHWAVFGTAHFAASCPAPGVVRWAGGSEIFLAKRALSAYAFQKPHELLTKAGWKVRVASDEDRLLWTKLILNAAINPLGALSRKLNGELVSNPALRDLMDRAVREAVEAARRAGVRPLRKRMDLAARELCKRTAANPNSMLQDLEAGRPTEADALLKPLLASARGEKDFPVLRGLYGFVKDLSRP